MIEDVSGKSSNKEAVRNNSNQSSSESLHELQELEDGWTMANTKSKKKTVRREQ